MQYVGNKNKIHPQGYIKLAIKIFITPNMTHIKNVEHTHTIIKPQIKQHITFSSSLVRGNQLNGGLIDLVRFLGALLHYKAILTLNYLCSLEFN